MNGNSSPSGRQSFPTERIDQFWSHSWHGSGWRKVATAIYLNNGRMAALIATLGSMIVATLVAYGVLPDMNFGGPGQPRYPDRPLSCLMGGFVMYCLLLIFWRPRQQIFLDILCIDQEDADLKGAALVSMGAFLKSSDAMVVFWDPSAARVISKPPTAQAILCGAHGAMPLVLSSVLRCLIPSPQGMHASGSCLLS